MENGIFFSIISLVYCIFTCILFFTKEKIKTKENKIYNILLILTVVGLLIEIFPATLMIRGIINVSDFWITFVLKLILVYMVSWSLVFTYYVISISITNKKTLYIFKVFGLAWYAMSAILIMIFPLNYYVNNGAAYSYGLAANYVYAVVISLVFACILFLLRGIKRISIKKYYPLIIFIVLGIIVTCIQRKYPELTLTLSVHAFVIMVMYHTIENPDLKLINELNMAKDQAEKANRAKTDFLSSMSHEIRTPLNAIVGFSNSLNDNKDIPESAKADVKDILVASDNLLEIVNGVLDISKIEANKIEIIKKEYDTKKMLDELSKLTKVRIGEKPIEFITKFDESLPRVLYGDQTRVKQVILNILTNAAKYTDKGKIIFSVQSIIKDNVCRMIVSVEDTGRGIKKESIDKLFTKFERLDEDRNTTIEGTGLGLAITKKLVELMHGKIVVQSKYGEGSKFTVSIDQKIVKNPTISLDNNSNSNLEVIDLKGKKVLVVDDNKLNLKVATRLLTPYNLEIVTSESGFAAIELLKNNKYDIILMDDMMPKMSGTETLKEIKKNELYDGPVVALTANALTGMKEKYIELGFTDYLAKPIEKAELNRVLKTYLTKK